LIFRFGRHSASQSPTPVRFLVRLLVLTALFVSAMVLLRLGPLRYSSPSSPRTRTETNGHEAIQTMVPPSPYQELGDGVIASDGRPKPADEAKNGPVHVTKSLPGELPVVDQELLRNVLDKTEELAKRPYYHLVTVAAGATNELLERNARTDIRFAELWQHPERHRGELVYLKGYLRGLVPRKAIDNGFFNPTRVETLYEGYLFTDDSRPNPYVIVVPNVAPGMPVGGNISESVTFAGYFLKLWRYDAADGTDRAAPLLIGRLISWTPRPRGEKTTQLSGYLAAAFILLVLSAAGAIWAMNRRAALPAFKISESATGPNSSPIAGLAELEKIEIPDPISGLTNVEERVSGE